MRYIDADNAKEIYLSKSAGEQLDRVPTADVQEVKHGEWIEVFEGTFKCSICGNLVSKNDDKIRYNFCHYCGARMDGE